MGRGKRGATVCVHGILIHRGNLAGESHRRGDGVIEDGFVQCGGVLSPVGPKQGSQDQICGLELGIRILSDQALKEGLVGRVLQN